MIATLLMADVQEAALDTSYGRISGDSALAVAAGVACDVRGVRGSVVLRYRYLQTAGVYVAYEEGFGGSAEPARVVSGGLELRPLFLGRWLTGLESGRPGGDLLIDSLAFELGGYVAQPAGGVFDAAGLELGVGLELPLMGRANGPYLAVRAALRWSRDTLAGAATNTIDDRAFVVTVTLGWQAVFNAHLASGAGPL